MSYKPNPDDRSDNVEKLQDMITNTEENIKKAEEAANISELNHADIEAKNDRRRDSIAAMKTEMEDEQKARENGYQ